jgi:outer membrane protein OmpA-like peptidoglycan-associated protein
MKKLLLFAVLLTGLGVKAQDYLGFNQSNYAGVSGIYGQPASIANGRDRFDLSLIGVSFYAYNNYVGMNTKALCQPFGPGPGGFHNFSDPNFQKDYLTTNDNSQNKKVFVGSRIAGPSFLINIDHKNAIAFAMSERNYVNVDGVSSDLAKLLYNGLKVPSLQNVELRNVNLSVQTMSWAEYGLTFAHVFTENTKHFFKAGVTLNILQGIQSAYVYVKDLNYKFPNDTLATFTHQGTVNYGHSSNLNLGQLKPGQSNTGSGVFDFSQSYPGIGFNFGAVYEWRPDFEKYEYDMDGEHNLWRRDQNKYKAKIGVTLSDLGWIRFKKGSISNDFNADIINWNLKSVNPKSVAGLDSILKGTFQQLPSPASYTMRLPTVLSVQAEYYFGKNIYVNFTPYFAFQMKNVANKVHDITSFILTPRWDHKWFGAFAPIQYNLNDGFRAGLAIRLGPLAFGTTNIAPLFGQKTIYGADAYVILKVPIFYRAPRDKDKDGISDKKDKCKDVAGVQEFNGCPDRDGDHIPDSEDKCPDVPGTKEMKGCPDKDGDGITDLEDACPDEKGTLEFKGCPDRDGDKIIDKDDECPDEPGLPEYMGCPDRDGDKVIDKIDLCPDVPGPIEYKGCPDKDGDTVLDKDDACPDVAGPVENKGCPWPDSDKDGVVDREDDCPNVPGLKELKGCPPVVIKAEEQKIIEKAFANLEFASGKDIIKASSFPSLNDLAKLLKAHTGDWTLKLSGHTDNQGTPESNMILSEKRAKAVKKYLVSKGEKADKVIVEWFGQTKPIDTNDTPAGRQRNRRVEMKIITVTTTKAK